MIGIRTLRHALRMIHKAPDAEYPGWEWYPVPGRWIVRDVVAGIHDRINRRAGRA